MVKDALLLSSHLARFWDVYSGIKAYEPIFVSDWNSLEHQPFHSIHIHLAAIHIHISCISFDLPHSNLII